MHGQLPAPTASGSLAKTPFPHLLVYALERRLSGTFELTVDDVSMATMLVIGGCPAKVRAREAVFYLGTVLAELGWITSEQLQASLAQVQDGTRLQGQVLLEMGAITPEQLEAALRSQVERKVEQLFALSSNTTFNYYDGIDLIQEYGGPPTPIDPFPVLWRGVRQTPSWEHVDATLQRTTNAMVRISSAAQIERFAFAPQELAAVEAIRERPARLVDVTNVLGPAHGQTLVYLLMILKQVELVEAPAPPQPAAAASPPVSSGRLPPSNLSPSTGQAFARVQLQRQAARPLIVEEQVAPSSAHDERTSSPGMQAPASAFGPQPTITAAPAVPSDIGSMISTSISPAPLPDAGAASQVPKTLSSPTREMPPSGGMPVAAAADEPTAPALTVEQNALKTKILERAELINSQDYFQMLGLDRDATPEAVQKAFIALAKVWHPDRLPAVLIDVKEACSKVFTHLSEAHATLVDPAKRQDYMTLLKDGGATPDDQAKIQAILEAATEFQKAEHLIKRNLNDPQAYALIKRCVMLDNEQPDYMATLAWLDAQKPDCQSKEKTLEKVLILDRCIQKNPNSERAHFYRAMLYKRADVPAKALKDFKRAAELNPRNLDAAREVRLHNMRSGASKPPPAGGERTQSEVLGGLFGKLFKK
jgi:hypothetical protein